MGFASPQLSHRSFGHLSAPDKKFAELSVSTTTSLSSAFTLKETLTK